MFSNIIGRSNHHVSLDQVHCKGTSTEDMRHRDESWSEKKRISKSVGYTFLTLVGAKVRFIGKSKRLLTAGPIRRRGEGGRAAILAGIVVTELIIRKNLGAQGPFITRSF